MISIIAAISENRTIGKNNRLPWHIPEDLKRFKSLTLGHPIIMGRTTFESIRKPLPGRTNIIVTRNKEFKAEGCVICNSLNEAINVAKRNNQGEIFIIGGGQIYEQAIEFADKIYLTIVKGSYEGDAFFPDYAPFSKIISKTDSKDKNYSYTFFELERAD